MNARRAEGRRPFIATLRAVRTREKCSLFCSLLHVRMFTFRCPNLFTFKRPLTLRPEHHEYARMTTQEPPDVSFHSGTSNITPDNQEVFHIEDNENLALSLTPPVIASDSTHC